MKRCSDIECDSSGIDLPEGDFHRRLNGLQPKCKSCTIRRQKAYEQSPAGKVVAKRAQQAHSKTPHRKLNQRERHLWDDYGITLKEYEHLLKTQGGGCAICGRKKEPDGRWLCVDHRHVDGYKQLPQEEKRELVRAILCRRCNFAVGYVQEDLTIAKNLVKFLRTFANKGADT